MKKKFVCGLLGALCATVAANQPGQLVSDADLKAEPSPKADTVGHLKEGQSLSIRERRGGWYAANAGSDNDTLEGWVRMLHIRILGTPADSSASTSLSVLLDARRGDTTVATGIRGLSEAQIKQAKEDTLELKRLDAWLSTEKSARQFATEGQLQLPAKGDKK